MDDPSTSTNPQFIAPGTTRSWMLAAIGTVIVSVTLLGFVGWKYATASERLTSSEAMVKVLNTEVDKLQKDLDSNLSTTATIDKERTELKTEKETREATVKEQTETAEGTKKAIEEAMAAEIEAGTLHIEHEGPRLTITLAHEFAFEPGDVKTHSAGDDALARLGAVMSKRADHRIHIVGHTDNQRPKSALRSHFPNNWALSAARAAVVANAFEKQGVSGKRIVAAGQGEERPVASNSNPKGRAKNRRVEIVLAPMPKS
jgi:chemotaxis protein MotB